jgi:hypothetical protein
MGGAYLTGLLEMMQKIVNGMNESKRPFLIDVSVTRNADIVCLTGEQLRRNVRSWLSPPDPWENYNVRRESHHEGTSRWFIQGDTFAKWKSSAHPLLWIHGKRVYCFLLSF